MTPSEQPAQPADVTDAFAADLAADSRERAVGALLKIPALRRLWSAQLTGAVADRLGMLALVVLTVQAVAGSGAFGGGYRGVALATAAVLAARLVATLLFGVVLLGPLSTLTDAAGPLDRRWTLIGADGVRLALFIVAPLWVTWVPGSAHLWLLLTAFVTGLADRLWAVAKDGAAPSLLPPPGDTSVRPAPDHLATLHRLSLRTGFVALPLAAAALVVVTLVNTLIGVGVDWFHLHQVALSSYVAAGLFSSSVAVLFQLELPSETAAKQRSPLEGLRLPKGPVGAERGRSGALPLLVLATSAVAGAIGAAVAVSVLHAGDLGFGPVGFGLLVLAFTAGTVVGIRVAPRTLPGLSRRRLLSLAIGVTGLALLLTGVVADQTTVVLLALLSGISAGVTANTGHVLIEQEAEEPRRARTTEHLQAVARAVVAVAAVGAPLLAAAIGPHRIHRGHFTFDHGGAEYTLMLIGALLLPIAALVLGKTDDRSGVPFRRDLREALRGGEPAAAPAATGFFIALEGGDGAGKSTQVDALARWIRAKGHEVVVTREPGATAVGKRLRSILLDVSSAGISNRAEALLYAADRAEHVDSVVRPALARGAIVISDRYIDSSVAYQGAGRDLAPTEIARINRWATGGLIPHLTVLLDVSPETARERFTEAPDRLESEPAAFHQRVRAGFLTLAAADPARYLVVDAGQAPEAVTTVVRHRLDRLLPLSQQEIEARAEAERKAAAERARLAAEEAARKAEEERAERERQAQLEKLHREEQERRLAAEEAARREIAERKAEQEAEEARLRQQETDRIAAEAAARRAAEEQAHAEEQARLRRLAEEQTRLRAEADERRREKQRKAEAALLRAEAARTAAAAAAAAAAAEGPGASQETAKLRAVPPAEAERTVELPAVPDDTAVLPAVPDETVVLPAVPPAGAADETAVLPAVPAEQPGGSGGTADEDGGRDTEDRYGDPSGDTPGAAEHAVPGAASGENTTVRTPVPSSENTTVTTPVPAPPEPASDPSETTRVLPPVAPVEPRSPEPRPQRPQDRPRTGDTDDTAARPPARDTGSATDRVPEWLFRPERPESERTRELPTPAPAPKPRSRPRPDWAEETPLDDLPTLADELLGWHYDEDDGPTDRRPR
ncbi:dTMP kinase [Actinacidiphila sp. ITFR-21]|uniref:dTMP kinase n=1 Tax=Actinacidiphila sp. ITFR-21 TaxID=3075199 RepID=UPI0028890B19|nr:dTMP kinase [Streptomyces sp. ITFR-21]WNI16966.1 dTMP kinase [Streptomyces sp. ITFR-21]